MFREIQGSPMVNNPKDQPGKLHSKMLEAIELMGEQTKALHDCYATLKRYQSLQSPVPSELFRDIRAISVDILEFLDYADSFSSQSTVTRCIIQDYLELCEENGLF